MPDIVIPNHLRPADGRFGCGPSKVRTEQLAALEASGGRYLGTSPERGAVRSLVDRARSGLREFFGLPDGYEVVFGGGGPSAFWNCAAYGLIRRRVQHLSFGLFSSMFAAVSGRAPWLEPSSVIGSPPGEHPWPKAEAGVDAYALTHCETSTGVAMPIERIGNASGDEDELVLVDGTSAAGGLFVDPKEFDVYYFGPQKCFGGEGSVWVALMSPAALARIEEIASNGRYIPDFFSLQAAVERSRRGEFAEEAPVTSLFLLVEQMEWMVRQGGLAWCVARTNDSARRLYGWAQESTYAEPFVRDPAQRSAVAGTVDLDGGVDAPAVIRTLRSNGIVDLEANRRWGPNQLRVGMYPAIDPADVEALTTCVDHVVERIS